MSLENFTPIPRIWKIRFYDHIIDTIVTSSAVYVDHWIHETMRTYHFKLHKLMVGLDTEWCLPTKTNKQQKVAILQLCIGHRCLIFQFCHKYLVNFLENNKFTFVGKAIGTDAKKLFEDYDLHVAKVEDVSEMAATAYQVEELRRLGLRTLALKYLNVGLDKCIRITLSKWDRLKLSKQQIEYAAIDAFVSFQLGVKLKQ